LLRRIGLVATESLRIGDIRDILPTDLF